MLPATSTDRRELLGMLLAGGVGAAGTAAFGREPSKLTNAEYETVSASPKTVADHRALAKFYRALVARHQAEAKTFETLGAQYAQGVAGATADQACKLATAAQQAAEHAQKFADALVEIAAAHEAFVL